MKLFSPERLWSPQTLLTLVVPFVLLTSGCNKKSETAANVPTLTTEDRIKSVEKDTRMPADVKAREIERIKAESRGNP